MAHADTIARVLARLLANDRLFRDADTADGYLRLRRFLDAHRVDPRELSAPRAVCTAHAMRAEGVDRVKGFVFPHLEKTEAQRALAFVLVATLLGLCPRCGGEAHAAASCRAAQTEAWACGAPLWGGDPTGAW